MAVQRALAPEAFKEGAVSPETAATNAEMEKVLSSTPAVNTLPPQQVRDARESGESVWGPLILDNDARDRSIAGPVGEITLRVFTPARVDGVYLHIHGGGWVLGRAHHQDPRNRELATNCSVVVVSVDYRLAPENPYPAGPDDCEAAALWLVENARAEFGTDRLVIGGESAGAHLSANTLIRMRDRHGYAGFLAANLVYGVFDVSGTPSCRAWGERNLILNTPIMEWFGESYAPPDRQREPDVSPLYADLHGLPPALFTVGTLDPLLDDSLFMYTRWLAAGNQAELAVYPGGAHGFNMLPIELGREANARCDSFVRDAVSAGEARREGVVSESVSV
jgi:acetyl esterase/lipase